MCVVGDTRISLSGVVCNVSLCCVCADIRRQLADQLGSLEFRMESKLSMLSEFQEFFKRRGEVRHTLLRAHPPPAFVSHTLPFLPHFLLLIRVQSCNSKLTICLSVQNTRTF